MVGAADNVVDTAGLYFLLVRIVRPILITISWANLQLPVAVVALLSRNYNIGL